MIAVRCASFAPPLRANGAADTSIGAARARGPQRTTASGGSIDSRGRRIAASVPTPRIRLGIGEGGPARALKFRDRTAGDFAGRRRNGAKPSSRADERPLDHV